MGLCPDQGWGTLYAPPTTPCSQEARPQVPIRNTDVPTLAMLSDRPAWVSLPGHVNDGRGKLALNSVITDIHQVSGTEQGWEEPQHCSSGPAEELPKEHVTFWGFSLP